MGESEGKNKKHNRDKIKQSTNPIKGHLKQFLSNKSFIIVSLIVVLLLLLVYFNNLLIIEKDMLFWLFAATSQSMAALFAVVGMFAVFRYQTIVAKLRNLYDVLKNQFMSPGWGHYFGAIGADCWADSNIVVSAEYHLKQRKGQLPEGIREGLKMSIGIIKRNQRERDGIIIRLKIPMVAVLITFMLSIVSIPFTEYLSKNCFGLIIILILLVLITFSMTSILRYFIISIPPK